MEFTILGRSSMFERRSHRAGKQFRKIMKKSRARRNRTAAQVGIGAILAAAVLGAGAMYLGRILATPRPTLLSVETAPPWDSMVPENQ